MATVQGVFFLFFGLGLLIVDYQSLSKGWLPCGPNGFKEGLRFRRADHPVRYWFMFALYGVGGIWLAWQGLALLF